MYDLIGDQVNLRWFWNAYSHQPLKLQWDKNRATKFTVKVLITAASSTNFLHPTCYDKQLEKKIILETNKLQKIWLTLRMPNIELKVEITNWWYYNQLVIVNYRLVFLRLGIGD